MQKSNSNLHMDRQCKKTTAIYIWTDSVKKTTDNLHMDRQCKKKKQQTIYIWTDSAKKKKNRQFTYGQTVQKKTALEHLQCSRQCKKTQQQQFTYGQTVQKNNSNLHMDRQCKKTTAIYIWTVHIYRLYRRQCAKYTYIYSVHIVYYKDILNYQRHIIHHMGTSALCTVSIHNVVYA